MGHVTQTHISTFQSFDTELSLTQSTYVLSPFTTDLTVDLDFLQSGDSRNSLRATFEKSIFLLTQIILILLTCFKGLLLSPAYLDIDLERVD